MAAIFLILFVLPIRGAMIRPDRLSPYLVGWGYVAGGFVWDGISQVIMAEWASRIEMARFAITEAGFFATGLVVMWGGLRIWPQPDPESTVAPLVRGFAWGLWVALIPVAGCVVLNRLPS